MDRPLDDRSPAQKAVDKAFAKGSSRPRQTACGCHASVHGQHLAGHDIVHCPLHAAAPALLEALERTIPYLILVGNYISNDEIDLTRPHSLGKRCDVINDARVAIAAVRESA